jgi:hypothetical protein
MARPERIKDEDGTVEVPTTETDPEDDETQGPYRAPVTDPQG